ncbi:acetyltransferase [Paenibacillus baekrokdamisoli]|uniref:Acetyltransferase n=1 Tax=Paenibacillus baekrokdamisoli TaxID=1712516 RepID=A0A3G9JJU1_9BACL|nr:GNAT family N-acetyltransferase [Paenibacillus baekrokdamisoli]MBB3072384.1 putative acetyltransferase [Paenibacillus baekrokdamisoli]BBH23254.1 acetyltransferase [Paenibacillus baekrokdamisoli]
MEIVINKVSIEQKNVLENLMTLFLHDLSEYADDIKIDSSGLHRFDVLDLFFEKEGLTPFFIQAEGEIIGFILIQSGPYSNPEHADYVLNSFFILRRYRRRGTGTAVASKFLELYPGRYCCAQLKSNTPAVQFWKKVYAKHKLNVVELERLDEGNLLVEQYFKV